MATSSKKSSGAGKFFLGALIGAAAGAVAGKLFSSRIDKDGECNCGDECECGDKSKAERKEKASKKDDIEIKEAETVAGPEKKVAAKKARKTTVKAKTDK